MSPGIRLPVRISAMREQSRTASVGWWEGAQHRLSLKPSVAGRGRARETREDFLEEEYRKRNRGGEGRGRR